MIAHPSSIHQLAYMLSALPNKCKALTQFGTPAQIGMESPACDMKTTHETLRRITFCKPVAHTFQ